MYSSIFQNGFTGERDQRDGFSVNNWWSYHVPSRSLASASVRVFEVVVWLDSSLMLFLVDGVGRPPPFLDGGADGEAEAALAAETFFDLEDCCAAWVEPATACALDDEQWHVENPLKKQTEHWMAMAPSDFRSKVADCCKIIVIFSPLRGVDEAALCTQLEKRSE